MKLITLNAWGGRVYEPLMNFFRDNQDVDVFCLQEIYHNVPPSVAESKYHGGAANLYSDIQIILEGYQGYFRPQVEGHYGLAIFVKKEMTVESEGEVGIYDVPDYSEGSDHPRSLQYITFNKDGKDFLVAHVHGLWTGGGKKDTLERLEQSRRIRSFLDGRSESKILCGDFNLEPTTESLAIIEEGLGNLVDIFGITSTRTSFYTKPVKFADYVFCNPDVKVKSFRVMEEEVSDHAALLLEWE